MAGGPQDVAQRHAQDALVASSHRFCVFLGAARAGHFVNDCAFRAHTTDMCGFYATGRTVVWEEMGAVGLRSWL